MGLPTDPTTDLEWTLVEEGFVLAREHEVESLLAIGNGYLGSRGSLAEGCALSTPATLLAGVFEPGLISGPGFVRLADWSRLLVSVEDHPLRLDRGRFLEHRRILDLRQGMLWREWRHQDEGGRVTRLRELRFASLVDRHLLIQSMTLTPEDYSGKVSIDATPTGALTHVTESGIAIAMAMCTRLIDPGGRATGFVGQLSLEMGCRQTYRLNRVLAVHTSREPSDPLATSRR